jgi:hypothetical protein
MNANIQLHIGDINKSFQPRIYLLLLHISVLPMHLEVAINWEILTISVALVNKLDIILHLIRILLSLNQSVRERSKNGVLISNILQEVRICIKLTKGKILVMKLDYTFLGSSKTRILPRKVDI